MQKPGRRRRGGLWVQSPSEISEANLIPRTFQEGYFRNNPAEDLRNKTNASKKLKEFLEADEYMKLIQTPIDNLEIRDAYIFSCYTGLRWCDVKKLQWSQIQGDKLITTIIQKKTGKPVETTLHQVAETILENRKKNLARKLKKGVNGKGSPARSIFRLPTADGANKSLGKWVRRAGIDKDITWHSARLGFSILLQDANVDTATVALLLGHTSTRYVNEIYKRHRPKNQ